MKRIVLIFLWCFFIGKISIASTSNIASTPKAFWLMPNELKLLQTKAFEGDAQSAARISLFYALSVNQYDKGEAWNYIAAVFDRKYMHNLNYMVERNKLPPDIFSIFAGKLDEYKQQDDTFAHFVLYKYYDLKGNEAEASKYRKRLEDAKVDSRLLERVKFNDYTPNVNDEFLFEYTLVQGKDLMERIFAGNNEISEIIKHGTEKDYYIIGALRAKYNKASPLKYWKKPLEIIFYKEENPYYKKSAKLIFESSAQFYILYIGEKAENLKYAIMPLKESNEPAK